MSTFTFFLIYCYVYQISFIFQNCSFGIFFVYQVITMSSFPVSPNQKII